MTLLCLRKNCSNLFTGYFVRVKNASRSPRNLYLMLLGGNRHQKSYERRCYMLENTKQYRDIVFRDKTENKISFTDVFSG